MAGGIDWFRWHHGSVADQKFILIAKKSGASVAEVIAVWACLLEAASASEERGNPGVPDFEAMDCALGMNDGKAQSIYTAMMDRGVIDEECRIASWDKRQPKRERDESGASTERSRLHRQRQKEDCNATQRHATPEADTQRQETPRGEERREEEISLPPTEVGERLALAVPQVPPCPYAELVKAYGEKLPSLPQVAVLNEARRRTMNARWREVVTAEKYSQTEGIEYFRDFFEHCSRSPFLMGRAPPSPGRRPFRADLDWLLNPTNFVKVIEGKYHNEAVAA